MITVIWIISGTVDVLNGLQLCPHHYIEGLRAGGPAAKSGQLQAGDELLQVPYPFIYCFTTDLG